MKKSKKVFLGICVVFFIFVAIVSYDISSRTTFPGSKPNLKERLMEKDTVEVETDSIAMAAKLIFSTGTCSIG